MGTRRSLLVILIGLLAGAFLGFFILYLVVLPYPYDAEAPLRLIEPKIFYEKLLISYLLVSIAIVLGLAALGALVAYGLVTKSLLRESVVKLFAAREVNRTKDEFISMVLHHLRTPLSGVKWSLKLILKEGAFPPAQQKDLQRLYDENSRALDAVEHLIEASQASMGRIAYNFEIITLSELHQVIRNSIEVMRPLAEGKKLSLEIIMPQASTRFMKVDKEKIAVIVQTLLENAIQYTPSGGPIKISTEEKESNFFFQIADFGVGISDEDKPRIFLQFFRGKDARRLEPRGFGIGLYLIKIFIENHHGAIWFISQEGKGTTFTFRLPTGITPTGKFLEEIS